MKAAFLVQPNQIQIIEIPIPEPKAGEVRIKLKKVGICGSDIHLFLGHRLLEKPTIIGHEGFGIIDKIGEGVHRTIGERVAIEPNIPCKYCDHCLRGNGRICSNKRVIGLTEPGCFAEYICIPQEFCWYIPDEISDADAVVIEPMAVAVHALFSSKAKPGDTIAIVGLGAIGLLITHLALVLGYQVLVTEINASKLKMATDLGAISLLINGDFNMQCEMLAQAYEKYNVVAIYECAGIAKTASLVAASASRGSEIVLVGLSEKEANFQPLKIAREGITIVPSLIYDHPFDYRRTIQLIKTKVIQPSFIISNSTEIDNLQDALQLAAKGDESKIVLCL
jgi:threonine dehydrogenase-like Zn-dependent dehydrogenase